MKKKNISELLSKPALVCGKQCDQCLFSKNKVVSNERRKELLEQCKAQNTHFVCHKGTMAGINLVCKGFFDHTTTPYLELMKAAGNIEWRDPNTIEKQSRIRRNNKRELKIPSKPRKRP